MSSTGADTLCYYLKMNENEEEFSIKSWFVPFTTTKAICFIMFIGFVVYFNTLFNGFVWDDLSNILLNDQAHVLSLANIFGKSNINLALQYRPVVAFYFSFLYLLFNDVPLFYHFLNTVFHIGNSILVFILFRRFFNKYSSFFLSLVFLIHPMQVESVAWIANAGNIYFFFGLLSYLFATKGKLSYVKLGVIGSLILFTLLSKETGILFLFLIFVSYLINKKRGAAKIAIVSIPVILLYLFLRFVIGQNYFSSHSAIIPIARLSFAQRLLSVPEIIFYYLKTFFYPSQLVIMQFWTVTNVNLKNFYFPLAIDIAFFLCCLIFTSYLYRKDKKLFSVFIFFLTWFVVGMILNLQIFPLDMTVSDRWFYFPMVGLLGMLGAGVALLHSKNKKVMYAFWTFGILILLLFSFRTILRNSDWHDDFTLYMHDRKIQDNFIIESNIGWNYQHIKDYKNALVYYKNSVKLYPYWAISLNNLGYVYEILDEKALARRYLLKVLEASDYHAEEYSKDLAFTGWLLLHYDSPVIAKDFIKQALVKSPNNEFLWAHLSIAEYKLGDQENALTSIEKAKNISSNSVFDYLQALITARQNIPENINIIN
jgi:hypothetical protein